ncbi:MAG: hypothetical protein WKG00_05905 [Polyangiaceae bacterium]
MDGDASVASGALPNAARSGATLTLPAGATVQRAQLYWAAKRLGNMADDSVVLAVGGTTETVTAQDSATADAGGGNVYYQSTAEVTEFVTAQGAALYTVTDIDAVPVLLSTDDILFSNWTLVVTFSDPAGRGTGSTCSTDSTSSVLPNYSPPRWTSLRRPALR